MNATEHRTYLKLAFQCVGLAFNDEHIETIILTTSMVNTKKGQFSLMNAAKIIADVNAKFHPVKNAEDEFDEEFETFG